MPVLSLLPPITSLKAGLGHDVLMRRLEQIPGEIAGVLVRGQPQLRPNTRASDRFLVTGTGSSEAHARYFCYLINLYTDRLATYLPLSSFLHIDESMTRNRTLVVFSQGVSPNAQIALRRHLEFAHTVLFTSTTPHQAREAGKHDRADLISDIVEQGGDIVYFPLGEEYTTLIRFVGPMCGYLACLQFVSQLSGCTFEMPGPGHLLPLLDLLPPQDLLQDMLTRPELFQRGFNLICAAPISDFSQNLACKFMEGLFWNCPQISDFLQFAHGPFQQSTAAPRPVVILQGPLSVETELVRRSREMLNSVKLPSYVVEVNCPPLYSIIGFEAIFNILIMKAMIHYGIDQINWPGKGRDDQLYGFCADPAAKT